MPNANPRLASGFAAGLAGDMSANSRKFDRLIDGYFKTRLKDNPLEAAYAGLTSGEGQLGTATKAHISQRELARQDALKELDSISPGDLSAEQHLDRLAFRSSLLRGCEDHEWGRTQKDPDALDRVLNILLHELQRGEDEPRRAARNIRSLLSETPGHLKDAASLIDRPERVWVRIMKQTAAGSGSLFDAVAAFLKANDAKRSDARSIANARAAFERYCKSVLAKKPAPAGSFCIGSERLQRRVRDDLGLDYTLGEIESLAWAEVKRVNALMKTACAETGAGASPEKFIALERSQWKPPNDLLAHYKKETRRISRAFRSAQAMTFPKGESLKVRLVPEFMRHLFPLAAYSAPGPFAKKQEGSFWVNDLGLTQKNEAEIRAERQQHFGVSLTAAHEAYPGHHLQFATANQHPRKWRRLFAHAVFYEGWTLWCEHMIVELGIETTPAMKLQQLHDALWRCHRILVDLYLHNGKYSYNQAVGHMIQYLGMTKARAEADVNWYTQYPSVPMSYWLGRLENERLKKRLVDGRGWTLKRFNDWLLSFGTIPQGWIEKYGLD